MGAKEPGWAAAARERGAFHVALEAEFLPGYFQPERHRTYRHTLESLAAEEGEGEPQGVRRGLAEEWVDHVTEQCS